MERLSSYPHVLNLGHRELDALMTVPVIAEEKIDGSQISFSRVSDEVLVRSRGADVPVPAPSGHMFSRGVAEILTRKDLLKNGFVYRGEYLQKPKHNTLTYKSLPVGNIVIYDVETAPYRYLAYREKQYEAHRLNFYCVPCYGEFTIGSAEFREFLDTLPKRESILGGSIEGAVLKPRDGDVFGRDGKLVVGKVVLAEFKEKHRVEWKSANPSNSDVVEKLILALRTDARWRKVIQHLRDAGALEGRMQDVPKLLEELSRDTLTEEKEYIAETLWRFAWPQIERGVRKGLPEFYKALLQQETLEKSKEIEWQKL